FKVAVPGLDTVITEDTGVPTVVLGKISVLPLGMEVVPEATAIWGVPVAATVPVRATLNGFCVVSLLVRTRFALNVPAVVVERPTTTVAWPAGATVALDPETM